jgi:hypothetical protein
VSDANDSDPGFTIAGYSDVRLIGRGGFSTVYRALQTQYERVVALKVLDVGLEDERTRRQYQRECAATGRLSSHPNIVTIIDSGFTSGHKPYLTMDYYSQGSLGERVRDHGPLATPDVLRIGVKICGALESAHQKDILHRDIKPENILVSGYGEPALADFGIGTVTARLESSVTMHALTPNHAPPEVMEGKRATETSDIYSLGSTLYFLLAGRPAFNLGNDNSILHFMLRVLQEPVPPIPRQDVPPVVYDVLAASMAKDPAARYQSAAALGQAFQQLQAHLGYPVAEMVTTAPGGAVPVVTGPIDVAGAQTAAPAPPVTHATAGTAPVAPDVAPPAGSAVPTVPPIPPVIAPEPQPAAAAAPPAPPPAPSTAPPPVAGASSVMPSSPFAAPAVGAPAAGAVGAPVARPPGAPAPDATVVRDRHAPAIEPADLTPAEEPPSSSVFVKVLAVFVAVVLIGGLLLFGWSRIRANDQATAPPSNPTTPTTGGGAIQLGNTSTTSEATTEPTSTDDNGPTTTDGSGNAGDPPKDVQVKPVNNGSALQVTWTDPSQGQLPFAYEVLSPKGDQLAKISALPPQSTSVVVTKTDSGPLSAGQTYCVAVGTIGGGSKPSWAPAACTDGTTVDVS